jgi:hypothetical protein
MKLQTIFGLFDRGELTPHRAAIEIAMIVNRENVREVMESLPPLLSGAL